MFPEYSRSRLKEWILQGRVLVDGAARRPRDAVEKGELVEITVVSDAAVISLPESIDIEVVYEDDDLMIINKPAGLVVHPGAGNTRGTLMNGLLHLAPQLAESTTGRHCSSPRQGDERFVARRQDIDRSHSPGATDWPRVR